MNDKNEVSLPTTNEIQALYERGENRGRIAGDMYLNQVVSTAIAQGRAIVISADDPRLKITVERLAELERDAERYQHLKLKSSEGVHPEPDYYQFIPVNAWVGPVRPRQAGSLDAAIDAAIAGEKK